MKFVTLNQDQKDFYLFLQAIDAMVLMCIYDYSEEIVTDYDALCKIAMERFFEDQPKFDEEVTGFYMPLLYEKIEGEEPSMQIIYFDDFIGINYEYFMRPNQGWSGNVDGIYKTLSGEKLTKGLVYALIDPPYSLKLDDEQKDVKFDRFLHADGKIDNYLLLDNFLYYFLNTTLSGSHDHLIIYKWSDNWNRFFDGGKEWWGTFFWTVVNLSNKTIAVFAASSTD